MPYVYGNIGTGTLGNTSLTSHILALSINKEAEMIAASNTLNLSTDTDNNLYIEEDEP